MHGNKVAKISAIFVAATMCLSKGDTQKANTIQDTRRDTTQESAGEGER